MQTDGHAPDIYIRRNKSSVNIGALITLNDSTIGKIALQAIEMAVDDVNKNENVLNGTFLSIIVIDSGFSVVQGAVAAMKLLKGEVVAIAGPQTSSTSRFVAELGKTLQVPSVSFAATDPSLSASAYSYFVRIAHSNAMQMAAIASLIKYYGWKEVVVIHQDDDNGINEISALNDALEAFQTKISYRAALAPEFNTDNFRIILSDQLKNLGCRVFIVHTPPDVGISVLSLANDLGMLTDGFVWITTEWLSTFLTSEKANSDTYDFIQGVIGTRPYIPKSKEYQKLMGKWNKKNQYGRFSHENRLKLNAYGLFAYDTIWLIARAIDATLKTYQNFTFRNSSVFTEDFPVKLFEQGPELLQQIGSSTFNGASGPIRIDRQGDRMNSAFEIINIVGTGFRTLGFWTNQTGLQTSPYSVDSISRKYVFINHNNNSNNNNNNNNNQHMFSAVWPGNGIRVPRGWVFPSAPGKRLRIGVPVKMGFKEFITVRGSGGNTTAVGLCVDVFEAAVKLLPYSVPYVYVPFGNGSISPSYDTLTHQLVLKEFDAIVGDISITTNRSTIIDFTQPIIGAGLGVIVPLEDGATSNGWAFVRPFNMHMWLLTGGFFIFVGVVVCILERRKNPHFQGERSKQFGSIIWFSFSTFFSNETQDIRTSMGRIVMVAWLFVVLILSSSYTASLSSILTIQQLQPTINDIHSLQSSNVKVGYQRGSYVKDYMIRELRMDVNRLVPLDTEENYYNSLTNGYVGAIIDELPYIQSFLATRCDLTIAGQTGCYFSSLPCRAGFQGRGPLVQFIDFLQSKKQLHATRYSYINGPHSDGRMAVCSFNPELQLYCKLVPLDTEENYYNSLTNGYVGAIIDELPYIQSFLATRCDLTIAGQTAFTNGGWGFGFPKDSQLAMDMTTVILELAESGDLQKIQDDWLPSSSECSDKQTSSIQLNVSDFWGLFLISGSVSLLTLLLFILREILRQRSKGLESASKAAPSLSIYYRSFRRGLIRLKTLSFPKQAQVQIEDKNNGNDLQTSIPIPTNDAASGSNNP
eukprot:Gb_08197 [translate_table: standard]